MWRWGTVHGVAVVGLALGGCWSSEPRIDGQFTEEEWAFLQRFKLPDPELCPEGLVGSDCDDAVRLGKRLFFDAELSGEVTKDLATEPYALGRPCDVGKVSCASCHDSTKFFTDTRSPGQVSIGTGYTRHNALGLVNTDYKRIVVRDLCPHPDPGHCTHAYSWNGQYDAAGAVLELALKDRAMNSNQDTIACVVAKKYSAEYRGVFSRPPCAVVPSSGVCAPPSADCAHREAVVDDDGRVSAEPTAECDPAQDVLNNVGKVFDAYERRLIRVNSPFDRYIAGDLAALGADEKRGLALFIGKATCVDCHQPPLFSDLGFHNIGMPQRGPRVMSTDEGLYDYVHAHPEKEPVLDAYLGEFLTQPLRNVAETAPYMHAGQLGSLAEVIEFYRHGGGNEGYLGVKDPRIQPLEIDDEEARALEAFLRTLTSSDALPPSLTDPRYE